jgi:hypothetical protein
MNPRSLVGAGFKIFPVQANGKAPCVKSWEITASSDLYVIEGWEQQFPGCNWGIACGPSDLVVLDADLKGGGLDHMLSLDVGKGFPLSRSVSTPSGGRHLYFRGQTRSRVRMVPGIDIRSAGAYVVAAGTLGGAEYVTEMGPIPPCPQWLKDMAGAVKAPRSDASAMTEPDQPRDIERAEQYLRTAPPAVEGDGGNHQTFRTACHTRDFGLSEAGTLEMMLRYYNPRCEPEWDEAALARIVGNAFRYAQNDHGSKSTEARTAEAVKLFSGLAPRKPFLNWAELGNEYTERDWIANGWIPAGAGMVGMITGTGGTGKSLLALELAYAVASGEPWFGIPTTQMPTYYLSCEENPKDLNNRIFNLKVRHKDDPQPQGDSFGAISRHGRENVLCVEENHRVIRGPFYEELDAMLDAQDPTHAQKLLILDTLADFFAGNENDRTAVSQFVKHILGGLGQKHNATILLLAHPSKGASAYSGSTAWLGSVRFMLFFEYADPKSFTGIRKLTTFKANYGAAGQEIYLDYCAGVLVPCKMDAVVGVLENAITEHIEASIEAKCPYSLSKRGRRYIGAASITMKGRQIGEKTIMDTVNGMLEKSLLFVVSGLPRKNGLYITGGFDPRDDQSGESEGWADENPEGGSDE